MGEIPSWSCRAGGDDAHDSPLIYIGKGTISQRWGTHREWLDALARRLPGARYEVLVFQNNLCNEIESTS